MPMKDKTNDFDAIYREYFPRIQRYLTRVVGNREADDVAQEVFVKISRGLKNQNDKGRISSWIYKVATNTAIDRLRQATFDRDRMNATFDDSVMQMQASGLSTDAQAASEAASACIRRVIEELPENYRLPMILSELEGLTNQEIAGVLELRLEVVKIRLHRGKARLKKELIEQCEFSRDERNELTCDPKREL